MKTTIKLMPDTGAGEPAGSPAVETFEVKDPITGDIKNVPTGLKILIGHITSFNRNSKNENYEGIVAEMTVERDTLLADNKRLKDQIESGDSSADDKVKNIKAEYQKQLETMKVQLEDATGKYTDLSSKYDNTIIDNEMMKAISGKGIIDENDFIQLMKHKGNVEIKDKFDIGSGEPTGDKTVMMKLSLPDDKGVENIIELEAAEAIEKYIALDKNSHWIAAKLKSGGGGKNAISDEVSGSKTNGAHPEGSVMDALERAPAI